MPKAQSLVVAALSYGPPNDAEAAPPQRGLDRAGRIARYVWADHYQRLNELLEQLADDELRAAGFRAQVLIDSNHLVDRNAAWRAGLGWYGKNSNLLMPDVGSWVVLGSILTDAPLEPADAPMADGCGPCQHCIDDCPTNAIIAPGIIDATRCIAWLVQAGGAIPEQFRGAVGDRLYGCDDCQDVCPPNKTAVDGQSTPEVRGDIGWILTADDKSIIERHGRWYIADRDPNVIRRTALVVLGNTAAPDWGHDVVAGLIEPFLSSDNRLLRDHAVWAVRRLGLEAGGGDTLATGIALPECCGSVEIDDLEHCHDPQLHLELVTPVETRFLISQWSGGSR